MSLSDIAFPYKAQRGFGVVSFALVFVMLVIEIEVLVGVTLGIVAHRLDLFLELQSVLFPGAVLVSLLTAAVFAWRARSWSKSRIAGLREWSAGSSSYAEKIAARRSGSG